MWNYLMLYWRIHRIIEILKFQIDNQENHWNHRIPIKNNENHWNLKISFENHENHENPKKIISRQSYKNYNFYENHENLWITFKN